MQAVGRAQGFCIKRSRVEILTSVFTNLVTLAKLGVRAVQQIEVALMVVIFLS